MCKCKQAIEWYVDASIDEGGMSEGYGGGVEPDTDTSDWVCYQLVSYARCTRCGAREDRDALGGCWTTGYGYVQAETYLSETVRDYGMVPKAREFDLRVAW